MSERRCEGCRWWKQLSPSYGRCQRFPPSVLMDDTTPVTEWPEVALNWWCGEWQEREDQQRHFDGPVHPREDWPKITEEYGPEPGEDGE